MQLLLFEILLIKMPKNILDLPTIMNAIIAKEPNEYMHFFRTFSNTGKVGYDKVIPRNIAIAFFSFKKIPSFLLIK